MELPNKKFQIIYSDPPWLFKAYSSESGLARSPQSHYKCMETREIMALPIGDLADKDCTLFIWAVDAMLPDALEVINAWGFTYKTIAFTWVKKNQNGIGFFTGLGYWTRANPEICLLATRGHPKKYASDVARLVISRVREHSRKPDVIRNDIVRLCGNLPRVELFARQQFEGWDSWGTEAPNTTQMFIEEKTEEKKGELDND